MRTQDRRVEYTKKAIETALIELLQHSDLMTITVKKLCEKAGINRSTFYIYYRNTSEVLEAMEQEMIAIIDNFIQTQLVDNHNQPLTMYDYYVRFFNYIKRYPKRSIILINSSVSEKFERDLARLANQISSLQGNELSNFQVTYIIFGTLAAVKMWFKEDMQTPVEQLSAELAQLGHD